MGLDEHAAHEVELTALLHDVGKVAIPRRSSTSRAGSPTRSGR